MRKTAAKLSQPRHRPQHPRLAAGLTGADSTAAASGSVSTISISRVESFLGAGRADDIARPDLNMSAWLTAPAPLVGPKFAESRAFTR